MIKEFSEISIAIDLVVDAYKLTNPFDIQNKIEETLDMEIHINQILDYLSPKEDYEKQSYIIEQGLVYAGL